MLKKTKIICTQGPATDRPGVVEGLVEHGMNAARFNFSHGSHEEHLVRINRVRRAAEAAGKVISCILDTKGPEMRLGAFKDGKIQMKAGKKFTLTYDDLPGSETQVSISHKALYKEVKPGDTLLLSDGLVGLKVDEVRGKDILTTILNDGPMSTRKRVAAPGVSLSLPPVSDQDEKDIIFGIEHDMDFVAASFIQRADDVHAIRELIEKHNGHMEIISKIENLEGVKNFDAILEASDGIMVARGDLGVEVPAEDVPIIQKQIIAKCNRAGKPVVVATQMLETMTTNPRPTRAEVSDVGNAILDGTDVLMLSGETASGDYPIEAAATMARIAERMEKALDYNKLARRTGLEKEGSTTDAIAHATVYLAAQLDANAIITPTQSGYTARIVSKYRPKAAIVSYASDPKVARHLTLRWGVYSVHGPLWKSVEEMVRSATSSGMKSGFIHHGDTVVISAGMKYGAVNTGSIRVYKVD